MPVAPSCRKHARAGSWSVALAALAVGCVALAACSSSGATAVGSSAGSVPAESGSPAPPLKSIEMINPAPGTAAWDAVSSCFMAEAKKRGVSAKVVGTPGDNFNTAKALDFISQAQAAGVSGIAVNTAGGASTFEPALAAAKRKGMLVATMESGDATAARNFDVGIDIPTYARKVAALIASMPGQKNVAILTIALTGTPKIFSDTLAKAITADHSVKIVTTVPDNGDVTKDADLTGNILTAHPQTNVIVAVNVGTTAGVVTALKEHNAVGKTALVGLTLEDPAKAGLRSGAVAAVYVQHICDVGTLTVDKFIAAAQGKTVPPDIPVQTAFATKANYTTFDSKWF